MLILNFQPSVPAYRFGTSIEQVPYIFDVRWNSRAAAWYFDVLEQDETPIVLGVKVVLGAHIGRRSQHVLFRRGTIVAIDTTQQGREAAVDDLGTRVEVRYAPLAETLGRLVILTDSDPDVLALMGQLIPVAT